jgi:SAM-dependent methyltransferase
MTFAARAAGRGGDSSLDPESESPKVHGRARALLSRMFWGLNRRVWWRLPAGVRGSTAGLVYGRWVHGRVLRSSSRQMYVYSAFLRNRPALELMRRLIDEKGEGSTVNVAVLGCSIGAEVYSILWVLRSARPDLEIVVRAVDVSAEVVEIAAAGTYAPAMADVVDPGIFDRMTKHEMHEMFDQESGTAQVKGWLREGIEWRVDDACDPGLASRLGSQDVVVASNFLCHMEPANAERCLRNVVRLVEPGGYLFVSGIDLDVRTRVARDLGWEPVADLIEEIHDADPSLRNHWPWDWAGLEPFDRRRPDWRTRYATAFRIAWQENSQNGSSAPSVSSVPVA